MAQPSTMKAINLVGFTTKYLEKGDISLVTLNPTYPVPSPTPSQALIRVHATCITPYELTWPSRPSSSSLRIPCHDLAGTIISCPQPSSFSAGDRVFGLLDYYVSEGCMAEYVVAEMNLLAKIPDGLSFVEAASIPRAALTVWQAVKEHDLFAHQGSKVLVTGATGAVGRMGVQILRDVVGETGTVVAVGGTGCGDLKALGADIVVNYREVPEWEKAIDKVDAVLDCLGGSTLEKCLPVIRDNGRVTTIGSPPPVWETVAGWKEAEARGVAGSFVMTAGNGEQVDEIAQLVQNGKTKPSVSFIVDGLTGDGVRDGWSRALKGGLSGSVVVKIL